MTAALRRGGGLLQDDMGRALHRGKATAPHGLATGSAKTAYTGNHQRVEVEPSRTSRPSTALCMTLAIR